MKIQNGQPPPIMKPLLYGVMAYESASVAKIAKEKWDYRGGSHPCQDAANVRVNDPLAVGIEELKGFFSRVPCEGATKGMKKEKEQK
jgi:hypothetical protein